MEELFNWLIANYQWVVTTILSTIAATATVWRWMILPRRKNKQERKRAKLTELENERSAFLWLKGVVSERLDIFEKTIFFADAQMKIDFQNAVVIVPTEWQNKIQLNYNKKLMELANLLLGARNFVQNCITRNVERHLHQINNRRRTSQGKILWVLGSRYSSLDKAMSAELVEPIIRGYRVDGNLFMYADTAFCNTLTDAIFEFGGDLRAFCSDVNMELESDRSNGLLGEISERRKEIIAYLVKLEDSIIHRINYIESCIDELK